MEVVLANEAGERVQPVVAIAWYGGLAVTPTWWADEDSRGQYSLTHVASGARIWAGMGDYMAIRLMAALCERLNVDWTQPFEVMQEIRIRDPLLYYRVRQIIREVAGE